MYSTSQQELPPSWEELQALIREIDIDASRLELGAGPHSLTYLLKECKLHPDELELRIHKFDIIMKNSKQFLDDCDTLLQSFACMHAGLGLVYGAVRLIVTIAAAKAEILDEVSAGLNDVLSGLPLISRAMKLFKQEQWQTIVPALKAFVIFVKDVSGYVGVERHESIKKRIIRTFQSTAILRDVQGARKRMREALDMAKFGVLVNHIKNEADEYLHMRVGAVLERLHCTNYEHHLAQYIAKTNSIKHPCAWSDSHPSIKSWLSHDSNAAQLFITGRPGTGKSVFTAHMIRKVAEIPPIDGHRGGALLYYFCGADPTVDPYSNLPQKASFKAVAMTFLRQLLSKEHCKRIADVTLLNDFIDYALSSQPDKYLEEDLKRWIMRLLASFDTVRIIVDAVDQCEVIGSECGLISWILRNFTTSYAHVLLVASEGSPEGKLLASWPRVTLGSSSTTQADLEAYSRHVVRRYLPEGHPLNETLVQDIVKRSENMLLYIFFLDKLIAQEDLPMFLVDKRIEFLQRTPPGIFKMYSYYLHVQLEGFTKLPPGSGFEHIMEILLKLISSSLRSKLALTRENIHAIARRAAGVLFDIREVRVREDGRIRQHLVPIHRTLIEYFQASDSAALRSNKPDWTSPILVQLEALHKSVAETGPSSLLEMCCVALQDRKFQHSLNRYLHTADLCRQRLDGSSTRGVQPDSSDRRDIDRIRLQAQLCQDLAFSSCDSLEDRHRWLDRQRQAAMEDREWCRKCGQELRAYESCDANALPKALRDQISHLHHVLSQMDPLLDTCQETLSDLQTRHLSAYAFRNVIYYLHLTGEAPAERRYANWSSFESLLQSYLDQLDVLVSIVALNILPSLPSIDARSPFAKLAAMICTVERVSQTARKVISSSQKPGHYRFLHMVECLWSTRGVQPWTIACAKDRLWNPLYSAQIAMGFRMNTISDKLICLTLERLLLLLADAERLCFTDAPLFAGIGNVSFCIRQLRQLISHYLLFQAFDSPTTFRSVNGDEFHLNEFSKQGFTKLTLLCDVSLDVVDARSLPSAGTPVADSRSVSIGLAFSVLGFLSSHHTCVIFCLLSTPADIPYGAFRLGQTWPLLPFASAAGVVGCICAKAVELAATHANASVGMIMACAVPVLLLFSQRQRTNALFIGVLSVISRTEYLIAMAVGVFCFPLLLGHGVWRALEIAALWYGLIHLIVLAADPSGMRRRHNELAQISRKYEASESPISTTREMWIADG
ncbi:hypothetical protein MSAN_01929000 [Mycena sanguinolenta]|uniref:Nephrocystin 3-like N-terminal domain-containing protein n=1 Tax=Mycena sanguinolenta TaxID=230812 RepID=A0A8H7CR58_9AGAR|nr:hypothetical protein MSAN_01929000 [Mycena sanguinolenta]